MDMACMIPYSQKLLSLAVYDESKRLALEFRKQHQDEEQERSKVDNKAAAPSSSSRSEEAVATIAMMTDPVATLRLSNMRVSILDEYLRPSLMPNNLWSDIEQNWRYHLRIVAWARKEFLISKYGPYIQEAMVAYPMLRNSPQLSSSRAGGNGNKRQILLDLVHRGEINTDNIGGGAAASNKKNAESPFLRLPPTDTIVNAFRMKGWSNEKSTERIGQSLIPIARNLGGSIIQQRQSSSEGGNGMTKHIEVPVETNVSSTGLEEILEVVTRGYVKNCGPLNALCQEANFYQLYSREYVQQLGDYLLKRTAARRLAGDARQQNERLQNNDNDVLKEMRSVSTDTVVLDIGAGDGVLMDCLRDYMERKVVGLSSTDSRKANKRRNNTTNNSNNNKSHRSDAIPTMVATDDMSWRIYAKAEVEKLSIEQALEKYATKELMTTTTNDTDNNLSLSDVPVPLDLEDRKQCPQVIVLCSWMPMGQDWTSHFRNAEVDEYILIGEADDGSCGDNWLTWGNPAFYDHDAIIENNDDDDKAEHTDRENHASSPTPLYVEEGYQRLDMDPLTKFQFSSFDLANSKSSKTVSFRRKKKKKS